MKILFLSLMIVTSAYAGVDINLQETKIQILSKDQKPLADVYVRQFINYWKWGFSLICGERPPHPGFCHKGKVLKAELFLSGNDGIATVPAFSYSSKGKKDAADIVEISYISFYVKECIDEKFNPYGHAIFYHQILGDTAPIQPCVLASKTGKDMPTELTCIFNKTEAELKQILDNVRKVCLERQK
jgi:hypothetical protein